MNAAKKQNYENQGKTIIKALEKRNINGYYVFNADEAKEFVQNFISENATVASGGSMTLEETGILTMVKNMPVTYLDRYASSDPLEKRKVEALSMDADYYITSTNAITLDGELVNIDGNGNRVAAMIYGPQKVLIVTGMNKVTLDEANALIRVKNIASPANTVRLNKNTPCAIDGKCHNCLSDDCICSHTVITRRCNRNDRIYVLLIGEDYGY